MDVLEFSIPPLPHYIISGLNQCQPGYLHLNRQHLQVFDLLIVRQGCLYIGEEDRRFAVRAGEALILRPDCHHYGTEGCHEDTAYSWLHFQTLGSWSVDSAAAEHSSESSEAALSETGELSVSAALNVPGNTDVSRALSKPGESSVSAEPLPAAYFGIGPFSLRLSQFITLLQPARVDDLLLQLEQLKSNAHLTTVRFKQQILFQEILQQLAASMNQNRSGSQSTACAEQAASFLRAHYREEITTARLGDSLNFHPVYIARCMNREYGCSPMEYLLRYRIEQSKLLLMQTSFPIARIAEEVGFNQAPYFSSSFLKLEGISPRQYRQRFS
ncbi:helix-turn-helix transcriptional regulator [Paenibacillus sp. HW567]|uniref:helix-turn-helix transcriptional regulator n=1 Tax=Paenibacillus sp. HW567 TaxID=1034769 RepID=UPI00036B1DEC|nr:AraC family transcriptional regulator [Paenibacillus sp. HW567]